MSSALFVDLRKRVVQAALADRVGASSFRLRDAFAPALPDETPLHLSNLSTM